jgi:hypothetical protein
LPVGIPPPQNAADKQYQQQASIHAISSAKGCNLMNRQDAKNAKERKREINRKPKNQSAEYKRLFLSFLLFLVLAFLASWRFV